MWLNDQLGEKSNAWWGSSLSRQDDDPGIFEVEEFLKVS